MFNGKMKALTFSYDDGVLQDERLIEIFNKYGLKGTFNIKKIELVETIEGKVVNRYQVDITSEGQRKYAEELANKGESVPENLGKNTSSYNGSVSFVYPYKKEVYSETVEPA